jgi:hypothetical protein
MQREHAQIEMYSIHMYIYMANENDMDGFTPGKSCKDK